MNILNQIILLFTLILLSVSCDSITETTTPVVTNKEDLVERDNVIPEIEKSIEEIGKSGVDLINEDKSRIRATLFEWEGVIDDKYPIKLSFRYEKDDYEEIDKTDGILELTGWYEYETTKEAMRLSGEWNLKTKSWVLKRYKEEQEDEIFEGIFVSSFQPIVGTWKKIRTSKEYPFELNSTTEKEQVVLFAQKLGEALNNENAEELRANGVGVDGFGIYLDNLEGWRPEWDLTNDFFEGSTSYSSTARGSDYSIDIHAERLPFSEEVLIWESEFYTSYDKDEEEGEVDDDYNYNRSNLWWYNGQAFVDLLVDTTQKIRVTIVEGFYQIEDESTHQKWKQSKENGFMELIK